MALVCHAIKCEDLITIFALNFLQLSTSVSWRFFPKFELSETFYSQVRGRQGTEGSKQSLMFPPLYDGDAILGPIH